MSSLPRSSAAVASLALAALVATAGAAPAEASVRPMLAGRAPSSRDLAASTARVLGVRDLGRIDATAPVRVGVLLRYQHETELEMLVRAQGDRGSRYYHRYLTPAQWNAYFAPTAAQYAKVAYAMRRAGFLVDGRAAANRGLVMAHGRASAAERYFHTQIRRVVQDGQLRYANATDAVMPAEIKQESISVLGLHSIAIARVPERHFTPYRGAAASRPRSPFAPAGARFAAGTAAAATPKPITNATPAPNPNPDPTLAPIVSVSTLGPGPGVQGVNGAYGPYGMAIAYDYPVVHGFNGSGRATGSVINSDFTNADLNAFIDTFKLPRQHAPDPLTNRIAIDGGSGNNAQSGEETLDLDAIVGLAPGTKFYEYLIPILSDLEIVNAYNQAASDAFVDALNSSFGGCETDDPSGGYSEDYVAMQGAAKGITFEASTGDTGSNGCLVVMNGAPGMAPGIADPAAGYYFTAVGGTSIMLDPLSGTVLNEMGWVDGGGGVSKINPLPDWQRTAIAGALPDGVGGGTAATPVRSSGRNVPDIALFAAAQDLSGGYACFFKGSLTGCQGTSLSSPLWAAMQTEIDEVQGSKNGWVNPRLFAVYDKNGYAQYRDVTQGANGAYLDVPGYDNVTGIGAPLGFPLAGTE